MTYIVAMGRRVARSVLLNAVGLPILLAGAPGGSNQRSNVETLQITSKVFDNTRTIRVLLPPGYRDPANARRRYPVLYLNDGTTVFQSRTFQVEQRVYPLIQSGAIPPILIVGIDNGGSTDKSRNPDTDRANEFLPYPDVGFPDHTYAPDPPEPNGKLYPDFLTKEVMPLIARHYRVKTGAPHTGLGGFSYGGACALYTAIARPGVFGHLLLESTPLWIGPDRRLLQDAQHARKWPALIYVGSGTNETKETDVRQEGNRDEAKLIEILRMRAPRAKLKSVNEEGGVHDPSSWGRRFPEALRFLFGRD